MTMTVSSKSGVHVVRLPDHLIRPAKKAREASELESSGAIPTLIIGA